MLSLCKEGTTVVVYSLSRLSRSLKDLLDLVILFEERGTKLQRDEAIRMMNDGRSTKEVAKLFTVSEPTMRRIKSLSKLAAA
jgi:DNA invertase Pin-like site-specific DNA recombinase